MMKNKTVDFNLVEYCNVVADKTPVPGGGSVCGVYGAIASSLVLMVLSFTLGKEKFALYEEELEAAKLFFEIIRNKFFKSSDDDIESYGLYASGTADRESAVIDMIETPLEAMRMAVEALQYMHDIKDKVNKNLINDFLLAKHSFVVVFRGAEHNLNYNLDSVDDLEFSNRIKQQYVELLDSYSSLNLEN